MYKKDELDELHSKMYKRQFDELIEARVSKSPIEIARTLVAEWMLARNGMSINVNLENAIAAAIQAERDKQGARIERLRAALGMCECLCHVDEYDAHRTCGRCKVLEGDK